MHAKKFVIETSCSIWKSPVLLYHGDDGAYPIFFFRKAKGVTDGAFEAVMRSISILIDQEELEEIQ